MLALAACTTVGPDYRLPEAAAVNRHDANAAFVDIGSDALDGDAELPARWWQLYQDPILDDLVEQALQGNTALKVAEANLRRSAAHYDQALAAGGFGAELHAGVTRAGMSGESFLKEAQLPAVTLSDAGVGISYQFDLFGRLRRGIEAAHADHQAVAAARDLARISVVAKVAERYVQICSANHELSVAGASLRLQQQSRDITRRLVEAGRGTPTQLARAQAQVALLQAALPPLQAQRSAAGYQLATLLGHTPGQLPAKVMECVQPPQLSQPVPIGDGRALLARRPDVRQSERLLAASTAEIGVATAELYPDIHLGGSLGVIGQLQHFGEPATQQWTLGPLISWTVPTAGARARVRAMEAGADAALARFDGTVLTALQEVQAALARYQQDLLRVQALREAQRQAGIAADQSRRLYQAGRQPYMDSLDADRSMADADMTLAKAEAALASDQIHLFLALGGGWQMPVGAEDTASHDAPVDAAPAGMPRDSAAGRRG